MLKLLACTQARHAMPFCAAVQSLADAAYFLPAYDLRQCTLALAALRERQEAAGAALQPRKRFAFNRRAPKVAATSAAAQGPATAEAATAAGAGAPAGQPHAQQSSDTKQQHAEAPAGQPAPALTPQQQQQQQPSAAGSSGQQGAAGAAAAAAGAAASGTNLSGLRGQVIAVSREQASGREFTLTDLEDCSVYLLAPLAALFLHGLRRCRVFTGPVAGACFVEGEPGATRIWDAAVDFAWASRRVPNRACAACVLRPGRHALVLCWPDSTAALGAWPWLSSRPAAPVFCCRRRGVRAHDCRAAGARAAGAAAAVGPSTPPLCALLARALVGRPPPPHTPPPPPPTHTHHAPAFSPSPHPHPPHPTPPTPSSHATRQRPPLPWCPTGAHPCGASLRPLPASAKPPHHRALCPPALCAILPRLPWRCRRP